MRPSLNGCVFRVSVTGAGVTRSGTINPRQVPGQGDRDGLVGVDLGIASAHTVRVLGDDGREVYRRRCEPTVADLARVEAAAAFSLRGRTPYSKASGASRIGSATPVWCRAAGSISGMRTALRGHGVPRRRPTIEARLPGTVAGGAVHRTVQRHRRRPHGRLSVRQPGSRHDRGDLVGMARTVSDGRVKARSSRSRGGAERHLAGPSPSPRRARPAVWGRVADRRAPPGRAGYRRPLGSTSVGFRPAAIGTQVITGDPHRAAVPVRRPERRARRPVGSRHRVRRHRVHRRFQWPGSEGRHGAQTRRVSIGCIRQRRRDAAHLVEGAPLTAWSGCDARWPAGDWSRSELTVRRSPFPAIGFGFRWGRMVTRGHPDADHGRLEPGEGSGPTHRAWGSPRARIQPG